MIPLPFRSHSPTIEKPNALGVIFRAGLLCGILDISAAFLTWAPKGVPPEMLLQAIASGLLGEKSFDGGWETAALGGALHFLIAFLGSCRVLRSWEPVFEEYRGQIRNPSSKVTAGLDTAWFGTMHRLRPMWRCGRLRITRV